VWFPCGPSRSYRGRTRENAQESSEVVRELRGESSAVDWLWVIVTVKVGVNKSNYPIQNPLLLLTEPQTRDNMNRTLSHTFLTVPRYQTATHIVTASSQSLYSIFNHTMRTKITPAIFFTKYEYDYILGYDAVQSAERMGWIGLIWFRIWTSGGVLLER
jgi:hypothetical protein